MDPIENREKFIERLKRAPGNVLLLDEDRAAIEIAYDYAKYAHRAQERKDGERYFEHPRRVALYLLDELQIYDRAAVVAALLHDAYEDSPQYVSPEKVRLLGGLEAERMIRLLSKVPKEGYVDRLRRHADWKTLAIKLCDRYDNVSSLGAGSEEFQRKQTIETRDVYLPLFRHLSRITPDSHQWSVMVMVQKMGEFVEGWCVRLGIDLPRYPHPLE